MKHHYHYARLLALCQDLGVSVKCPEIVFKKNKDKIFGREMKIKDILFGEEGEDADLVSEVVNNLYLQFDNFQPEYSTQSGSIKIQEMMIVKEIAETFEEMLCFCLNQKINPDKGYFVYKGKIYKFPDKYVFFRNHISRIRTIREKSKLLQR